MLSQYIMMEIRFFNMKHVSSQTSFGVLWFDDIKIQTFISKLGRMAPRVTTADKRRLLISVSLLSDVSGEK